MMQSLFSVLKFVINHPLNSRQPICSIYRLLLWQIKSRLQEFVIFNWIDGSKLVVKNGMLGATGNVYCGLHEFSDMALLLHMLQRNDLFIDVGANVGSYTVLASGVCYACTVAVEPDPDTLVSLKRNLDANDMSSRVMVIEAAIGAESGNAKFTIGKDTVNRVASDDETNTRNVNIVTLDSILKNMNPVLLKIDVEGYEHRVISGAIETLRNPSLLAIMIETVDQHIRAELELAGFREATYDPFSRTLKPCSNKLRGTGAHNFLFVRDFNGCQRRINVAPHRSIIGNII